DTPVTVYGDPARLQQVVANLVHNAAKYTPKRGRVDVTVEERDDEAIVRVRDTGAGIPYEKLQTVFDLFVQLNVSKDRSEAGHRVEVAADGAQGIERAVTDRPDVAIVDLGLPGIDGFTVARELRTRLGPDLRIVALTGYDQSEDRRRTQEAGFNVHITKPATV